MVRATPAFSWTRPHAEGLVAAALVAVAIGVFAKLVDYVDRPIVDDALISIGYARSLADGDGLRPTPYSQIAEGYSNPTWTLLLACFEKLGVNAMRPAKTLGPWLVALSFPLVFLWGPLGQRRKVQLEDALAPLLACSNATLAYWSLGGLESGLLVFLAALFVTLLVARRAPRAFTRRAMGGALLLGLAGAAVALTRPEGLLYVLAAGAPWVFGWAFTSRLRLRGRDGLALASLLVPLLLYLVWRKVYFGAWLPNTYYAKHSWYVGAATDPKIAALHSLQTYARSVRPLLLAAAAGMGLSLVGGADTAKVALSSALVAVAMGFFGWYANGDWMKEWRFFAPAVLFAAYPVAAGVSGLRRGLGRALRGQRGAVRFAAHVAVAAAAAFALHASTKKHERRWREVRLQGGDTPRTPEERGGSYGRDVRAMIAPFGMTHALVAGPDLGDLSLGLRTSEIIDLAGLADVAIARHYGDVPALRDYLVHEGLPTVLLLWGPSNYLWTMDDVLAKYRNGKDERYKIYAGATETTDDRCPSGKASALAASADEMVARVTTELGVDPVRALAEWRCYLTYRADADLPSPARRVAMARAGEALAEEASARGDRERALRAYSFCAVVGATSPRPSSRCRMEAERLRALLFPRAAGR